MRLAVLAGEATAAEQHRRADQAVQLLDAPAVVAGRLEGGLRAGQVDRHALFIGTLQGRARTREHPLRYAVRTSARAASCRRSRRAAASAAKPRWRSWYVDLPSAVSMATGS